MAPQSIRGEIARLTATRPDPEINPDGFKAVNDEITRKIDQARLWQDADRQSRKVV